MNASVNDTGYMTNVYTGYGQFLNYTTDIMIDESKVTECDHSGWRS